MKCYYHPDEDSVAQCSVCYRFLCKYCYDNTKNGLCSTCVKEDELKNEEYIRASRERRKKECCVEYGRYKRNMIIIGGIGFIVSLGANILYYQLNESQNIFISMMLTLFIPYLFIAVYSGYIILVNWQLPEIPEVWLLVYLKIAVSILFHAVKLVAAIIVGIFGAIPLCINKREKYLEVISQNH